MQRLCVRVRLAELVLVVLSLAAPAAAADAVLPGVDALVETFMRDERVVGMAVAVMKGGEVVHAKGYGMADLELSVPATEHTVFRLASISKQFTALSLLMLAEQGKIDVDAGISAYFPEWPANSHVPTVARLLNHTSGLEFQQAWSALTPPDSADSTAMRDLGTPTLSSLFTRTTFDFPPGARFRYNNNAIELLGLLIERVSGISYASFIKRHIFEPLGMTESYYVDTSIIKNRASGYTFRGSEVVNAPNSNPNGIYAAGALGMSVLDALKWQRALLSNRLVSAASTKKMKTAGHLDDGTPIPYGFGLFLLSMEGKAKIEHYGNLTGARAQLAYYPSEDLTVTVLANTNPSRTEVLESRISKMLMGVPEARVEEIPMTAAALSLYAGRYTVTDAKISHRSVTTEITLRDDGLYAGRFRLRPVGGDVFVPAGDPYHHYTFTVRDGQAVALQVEREGRMIADATRVP